MTEENALKGHFVKHPVEWHELSIRFRPDADPAALFDAVEPPADVLDNLPPIYRDAEDTLERRLVAWGWYPTTRERLPFGLGVYGDYTAIEDDERFLAAIAPFVVNGSHGVFDVSDDDDDNFYASSFRGNYEAWEFREGEVHRMKAEKRVEWDY